MPGDRPLNRAARGSDLALPPETAGIPAAAVPQRDRAVFTVNPKPGRREAQHQRCHRREIENASSQAGCFPAHNGSTFRARRSPTDLESTRTSYAGPARPIERARQDSTKSQKRAEAALSSRIKPWVSLKSGRFWLSFVSVWVVPRVADEVNCAAHSKAQPEHHPLMGSRPLHVAGMRGKNPREI